jgi:hypothetical protein
MRERGLSYEAIANALNLWKIATRTGSLRRSLWIDHIKFQLKQ